MQIITSDENRFLLLVENNKKEYSDGISYDIAREMLNVSEVEMVDLLEALKNKNFVDYDDNKFITYLDLDQEVKVVKDKLALKEYMLNKTEEEAFLLINRVIEEHDGYAPKYVLEGELLYGELKLTPKRSYNIMVSLENRGLLNRVSRADGEYYTI